MKQNVVGNKNSGLSMVFSRVNSTLVLLNVTVFVNATETGEKLLQQLYE